MSALIFHSVLCDPSHKKTMYKRSDCRLQTSRSHREETAFWLELDTDRREPRHIAAPACSFTLGFKESIIRARSVFHLNNNPRRGRRVGAVDCASSPASGARPWLKWNKWKLRIRGIRQPTGPLLWVARHVRIVVPDGSVPWEARFWRISNWLQRRSRFRPRLLCSPRAMRRVVFT